MVVRVRVRRYLSLVVSLVLQVAHIFMRLLNFSLQLIESCRRSKAGTAAAEGCLLG